MIGFKKVPTKSILLTFLLSIFLIILLYADFITDDSLPEEKIQISEILIEEISEIPSYRIHEVMNGENLSIIFEEFKIHHHQIQMHLVDFLLLLLVNIRLHVFQRNYPFLQC